MSYDLRLANGRLGPAAATTTTGRDMTMTAGQIVTGMVRVDFEVETNEAPPASGEELTLSKVRLVGVTVVELTGTRDGEEDDPWYVEMPYGLFQALATEMREAVERREAV